MYNSDMEREYLQMKEDLLPDNLLNETIEDLENISTFLKFLLEKIISEKPDMIYFVGKSSIVFCKPFNSFLIKNGLNIPIKFFDDSELKYQYVYNGEINPSKEFLRKIKGKKVFFIDETFAAGRAAVTNYLLREKLKGKEIYHFSLSRTAIYEEVPDPIKENHNIWLKKITEDNRFYIGDYEKNGKFGVLFSKKISTLIDFDNVNENHPFNLKIKDYSSKLDLNNLRILFELFLIMDLGFDDLDRKELEEKIKSKKNNYQDLLNKIIFEIEKTLFNFKLTG